MQLRKYQQECVDTIIKSAKEGILRQAVVMSTGSGKTVIFGQLPSLVKAKGKKTLILAHREELLEQAKDKLFKIDPTLKVEIEQAEKTANPETDVVVASVPTLGRENSKRIEKFNPDDFGLVILDECFVKGTKIGQKNIEDIKVGDYIDSFNEKTKTIEKKKVISLFKNKANSLIKLTLSDKRCLVCTPNHPFYVEGIWKFCKDLQYNDVLTDTIQFDIIKNNSYKDFYERIQKIFNGKSLFNLWNFIYAKILESNNDSLLRGEMQKSSKREKKKKGIYAMLKLWKRYCRRRRIQFGNNASVWKSILFGRVQKDVSSEEVIGNNGKNKQKIRFGKNEEKQSNVQPNLCGKSEEENERKNFFKSWRKWIYDKTANCFVEGIKSFRRLFGICYQYQWSKSFVSECSLLLQSGYSHSEEKIGDRDRWTDTQVKEMEIFRQKKNRNFREVRVESIEILERRDRQRFEKLCPAGYVYNLEVEDNNNYFANGILVHNCHHATNKTYKNILRYFGVLKNENWTGNKVLLGVTATPSRADHIGLDTIFDKIVYNYPLRKGIDEGYLANIKAYTANTNTDISQVGSRAGDFIDRELEEAINTEERNKLVVETYQELTPDTKALVFAVDVQHTKDLCEYFQKAGIKADYVIGETDKDKRREIIQKFKTGEIKVLCGCGVFCLDLETEILTRSGWKRYNEMTYKELVANYNQNTGEIIFKKPEEIVIRDLYDFEKMVSVKNQRHNIRVTNTHRMLHRSQYYDIYQKSSAEDLVGKSFYYPTSGSAKEEKIIIADNKYSDFQKGKKRYIEYTSYNFRKRLKMSLPESLLKAKEIFTLKLRNLKLKQPDELSLDECRFIGFWLGDGSRSKLQSGGIEYLLHQTFKEKKGEEWIDNLLQRLDLDSIKRRKKSVFSWSIPRGTGGINQMKKGVYAYEPYLQKDGSEYLWALNREQVVALIEGFWKADGDHGSHFVFSGKGRISNCNGKLLDLLQAICTCRGITVSLYRQYREELYIQGFIYRFNFDVNRKERSFTDKHKLQFDKEQKQEKVWCVKTDLKNLITRRKGIVTIMGNTEGFDEPSIETILMARPTKSSVLFSQMVGRGSRMTATKKEVNVVDFVDNTGKNKIMTLPSLFGCSATLKGTKGRTITEIVDLIDEIKEINPDYNVENIEDWNDEERIEKIIKEVNLFDKAELSKEVKEYSKYSWERFGEGFAIRIPPKQNNESFHIEIKPNMLNQYEIRIKQYEKVTPSRFNGWTGWQKKNETQEAMEDTLKQAFKKGDYLLEEKFSGFKTMFNQDASWREDEPTDKQVAMLQKFKISIPKGITKGQCSVLIGKALAERRYRR